MAPHWDIYAGRKDEAAFAATIDELLSREPCATALIVRDRMLRWVYKALERRGVRVGKDISVMGRGGLEVAEAVDPPATTVRIRRDVAATMALDSLNRLVAGERIEDIQYVPAELVVRESTGPAPSG